ncbi:MAG: sugar ABC transporter ATP-binding protein [Acidobacteria bacterium]|nr:sugar ABC transporter ATP-binding protein [Acidobacteriota bacterium]
MFRNLSSFLYYNWIMLLKADSINKSFAGVHALKGVSFDLLPGEVHALVGENGAGKSTLIKIISGALTADSGSLEINGRVITENSPSIAKVHGVAAIYQQPALFPDLTVAENISFGIERGGLWRKINWDERNTRAIELLRRVGARIDPQSPVSSLTMPEQQLVGIARALGASARILIMDEPTASLTEQEVERLFSVIGELRAEGAGIIHISHRLDELFAIADRVTVLRDGHSIATRGVWEVDQKELIQLMVGRELSAVFPKREVNIGEIVLQVKDLKCRAGGVHDVSFDVRAGEILGLAGLVGAGRTELARVLFGLTPADSGQITLRGSRISRIDSPEQAIDLGIAYLPEDRRRHGVILEMPIATNTTLAILRKISRSGFLDFRIEKKIAVDFSSRLAVKAPATFVPVATLSGGNQQKVALARWLATKPSVLILDEPTQGIDVGAKSEIHRLMCDLAEQGMAIIMISSELSEVLGMSDRIAVMREGRLVDLIERRDATQQHIIARALGH